MSQQISDRIKTSSPLLYRIARSFLFSLEPEKAHILCLSLLHLAWRSGLLNTSPSPYLAPPICLMGLNFPNPIGLAAGLDKNGQYIDSLAQLGFGFIEIGTLTPRPQPGNSGPRLFRLPKAQALINRMGFNNLGIERCLSYLKRTQWRGILGINIGKNADTPLEQAAEDYLFCLKKAYPFAHYIAINISSPNTAQLRDLQHTHALDHLLHLLKNTQHSLAEQYQRYVPLVVKFSPDLSKQHIAEAAQLIIKHQIDGIIVSNTTLDRTAVIGLPHADQPGGLSGKPLFELSNTAIRYFRATLNRSVSGKNIPIIGVGGISSAEDIQIKLAAGAQLVQLYSSLIYQGPGLIQACLTALNQFTPK